MERVKLAGFGKNGAVLDIAEYDAVPESFNEVRNVRFNSTGAVSFSGHKSVLSPAPITPLWLRVFPPVDFPRWVYADLQRVYVFDDGHIDISRPGGYNGVVNERWQGEVFNGVGIFNNTVDVPQMWANFNSATALADLANWPANLRAKFFRPFKNYIIAGFLTEDGNDHPFRVRWSHPADPGTVPLSWAVNDPSVDSGELELSETDDYIVDGKTLGEAFMVYKQKTAHLLYLTGTQRVFGQRTVISGRGALTRDCVQDIPGGHFVMGIDDIYAHSGQKGSEQSLVEAKVRKWIYNQIDASNFFNCYTVDYRSENEIWACFPEAGEIYPTIAMVWNKITGGIGFRDIQSSPFMWSGPIDERTTDGDIWGDDEDDVVPPVIITGNGALTSSSSTLSGSGGTIEFLPIFVSGRSTLTTSSIMTSYDGINWTMRTTPNMGVTGIAWSPDLDLFVAVGSTIATSPDGITWTGRTQAGSDTLQDVTWSPSLGLFAAVSSSGTSSIQTSPDGINWTLRTTPGTPNWKSVRWSEILGLFAAGSTSPGSTNSIMTSPDGITWTLRSAPGFGSPSSGFVAEKLAVDPTLGYFIGSTRGEVEILKSTDGTTWIASSSSSGEGGTDIGCSGTGVVNMTHLTANVSHSVNNGTSWSTVGSGQRLEGICYSADLARWVGVCNVSADLLKKAIYSDDDGVSWNDGVTPSAADTNPTWVRVIYADMGAP